MFGHRSACVAVCLSPFCRSLLKDALESRRAACVFVYVCVCVCVCVFKERERERERAGVRERHKARGQRRGVQAAPVV